MFLQLDNLIEEITFLLKIIENVSEIFGFLFRRNSNLLHRKASVVSKTSSFSWQIQRFFRRFFNELIYTV